MSQEIEVAKVYVLCECGQWHRLFIGFDKPLYWCGDVMKELKEGDTVKYEDGDALSSIAKTISRRGKPYGIPLRHWEFLFKYGRFPH